MLSPTHIPVCALTFTNHRRWVMDLKTQSCWSRCHLIIFGHQQCQEISDRSSQITLTPPLNLPQRQITPVRKKVMNLTCHSQRNLIYLLFFKVFTNVLLIPWPQRKGKAFYKEYATVKVVGIGYKRKLHTFVFAACGGNLHCAFHYKIVIFSTLGAWLIQQCPLFPFHVCVFSCICVCLCVCRFGSAPVWSKLGLRHN